MTPGPTPAAGSSAPSDDPRQDPAVQAYWRTHLMLLRLLLFVWAGVSLGCGVVFAEELNAWRLPGTGFKLGFWFAQQGSIYVFVALIFVYAVAMNRLEARHGLSED